MNLGIDTSCYTTSVAITSGGEVVWDGRVPLVVSDGALGLRQSDALFQHVRNLPALLEESFAVARARESDIRSVAASVSPRRAEGSYMPVFLASGGFGQSVAAALGKPLHRISHQEAHIAAGAWSSGMPRTGRFLALHLSGGTTELLDVHWPGEGGPFDVRIIGGTDDLNAGQFIDRVGVAMGLPFPAGPELERLARAGESGTVRIPVSVRGTSVSFSGPCSSALRALELGARREDVASAVLSSVAEAVARMCAAGLSSTEVPALLVSGGVAANAVVRRTVTAALSEDRPSVRVYFAKPEYARDNAVGAALLAGPMWGWDD